MIHQGRVAGGFALYEPRIAAPRSSSESQATMTPTTASPWGDGAVAAATRCIPPVPPYLRNQDMESLGALSVTWLSEPTRQVSTRTSAQAPRQAPSDREDTCGVLALQGNHTQGTESGADGAALFAVFLNLDWHEL